MTYCTDNSRPEREAVFLLGPQNVRPFKNISKFMVPNISLHYITQCKIVLNTIIFSGHFAKNSTNREQEFYTTMSNHITMSNTMT